MERRTAERELIALTIFDNMGKRYGLSKRDRLLLQLSAILSECGRYISLSNVGESSYSIITVTEIIGLSHIEREIVANIVKYSTESFEYYGTLEALDVNSYLRIAKLTAIIRLAEGLDLSHKGKCNNMKIMNDENKMILTVETNADMTLEMELFGQSSMFFQEVFHIEPVLRQKKSNI